MDTTRDPIPPAREIPMNLVSSLKSWWSTGEKDSAASEERLLRKLPFFQSSTWSRTDPKSPVIASSSRVQLSNKKHSINTLSILPATYTSGNRGPSPDTTSYNSASTLNSPSTESAPAVLLHGYGAGLGFFFQNFAALGEWVALSGSPLYALDWLGMGRSSRPPFSIKAKRDDHEGRVREAESFFVDALDEWRDKMGLQRMTLIGHSLGGYLSVAYALKYPTRVQKLILVSPAGIPRDPDAESPARELTDTQEGTAQSGAAHPGAEPMTHGELKEIKKKQRATKREETRSQKLFTYLWEQGWSPFQVIRTMSVFGPLVVGKYSSRRFSGLTAEETRDMNDYILNITLSKGSGEYCISHLLAPYAFARFPIVDRIDNVKVPVTFVYGDHDWMDPEGGYESVKRLKAAGNPYARMFVIRNAGHHVYLDNPEDMNELLKRELTQK